jgi:hypothetical protein
MIQGPKAWLRGKLGTIRKSTFEPGIRMGKDFNDAVRAIG